MQEVIWVPGRNSERTFFSPKAPDEVTEFFFVPPDSPGSIRVFAGAAYGASQPCFRRWEVLEDGGDVLFSYVSTGMHGAVIVGPSVYNTWPKGSVAFYGVTPGKRYVVRIHQENPDGSTSHQPLPLDFYVDVLRAGTRPGPQS